MQNVIMHHTVQRNLSDRIDQPSYCQSEINSNKYIIQSYAIPLMKMTIDNKRICAAYVCVQ